MNRFRRFMYGRYGEDLLNFFIIIVALVFSFLRFPFSYVVSWVLIGITIYRTFSKNIYKRQRENAKFMSILYKISNFFIGIKNYFSSRKHFRFYKCPECGTKMRVPKGKGKIRITCPECGTKFEKKT